MPLQTKPEDYPAAVRFHVSQPDGAFEVTVSSVTSEDQLPYCIQGGAPRFPDRDAFKARVVEAGMSPAVAEDQSRSFNATARQLRELGFSVDVNAAAA
ncbi:MAG TPA: hypothetical protein VHZ09_20525 [Acidobacteriaceae bacterium]|jgi:hypothetical protein|nr:hypothetical protein [Acidobacteriaceae bacterium]